MPNDIQDENEIIELEQDEPEYESDDDGNMVFSVDDEDNSTPPGDLEFYANLANPALGVIDFTDLNDIGVDLLYKIDIDKQSRADRDKQYEEGLRRTGLDDDAPGGASFSGASRTTHPMLMKATIEFSSHVMKELFPPDGPAKTFIPGTASPERLEKAKRKQKMLNWQLTTQIKEFRSVLEKTIIQVPLGGVQYIRMVWNDNLKRPVARFISVSDVLLPYDAVDLYSAERITFVETVTEDEYARRVEAGVYIDDSINMVTSSSHPEKTESGKQHDKITGNTPGENIDGARIVYETVAYLDIEGFTAPYIVRIDENTHSVKAIVRNWEEKDPLRLSMDWIIEFPFIPWDGPQAIGLTHMIGGLAGAATGALRALLDSAHINNFPTALVLDGSSTSGQVINMQPATLQRIKGGVSSADDIRKVVMGMPFNPPSPTLYNLLTFLVQTGEDMVRTVLKDIQNNEQTPVGTTMMMVENVAKVISAIHARLYAAMQNVLLVLSRINRMYQVDGEIKDEAGEVLAYREDFDGPMDVVPVSDPAIFSEVQRYSQMQAVAQRSDAKPGMYNAFAVEEMILRQLKIPDVDKLLNKPKQPKQMNAVNENVAMTMGTPVLAYPMQDHLGHLQVHLDFMKSPILGMSQIIAPTFLPAALAHIKEHIVMWYVTEMDQVLTEAVGVEASALMKFNDHETSAEMDRTLAAASPGVVSDIESRLSKVPPIIQQAQQILQQLAPQITDPSQATIAAKKIDQQTAREKIQSNERVAMARDNAQTKLTILKGRLDEQKQSKDIQAGIVSDQIKASTAIQNENTRQAGEEQRNIRDNEVKEQINTDDNVTALTIANAELAHDDQANVSTGSGINPRPSST